MTKEVEVGTKPHVARATMMMIAAALLTAGVMLGTSNFPAGLIPGPRQLRIAKQYERRALAKWDGPLAIDEVKKWVRPGKWESRESITTHGRTIEYKASPSEMVWLSRLQREKICATSDEVSVAKEATLALEYSSRAWFPQGKPAPIPTTAEKTALSHFRVKGHAIEFVEPIEPLSGIGRHPFAKVGCAITKHNHHDVDIFNISYIIVHNNCGSNEPKPKTFLFDMGASVGFHGIPGGLYDTMPLNGGGLAPSLPLLYRMYQDRCLEPDEIYAWEPNPHEPAKHGLEAKHFTMKDFLGEIPARVRAKVHYYEDFVDEGSLKEAEKPPSDPNHPVNSFLEILESVVNPDDFVAVKVDIDTPNVELTILEAIAERPEIAALIDELYFEYHYYFDGMNFGWGREVSGDVDTALGLMRRLRDLGVRAHFWI